MSEYKNALKCDRRIFRNSKHYSAFMSNWIQNNKIAISTANIFLAKK